MDRRNVPLSPRGVTGLSPAGSISFGAVTGRCDTPPAPEGAPAHPRGQARDDPELSQREERAKWMLELENECEEISADILNLLQKTDVPQGDRPDLEKLIEQLRSALNSTVHELELLYAM